MSVMTSNVYLQRRREVLRRMKEGVALFLAPDGGDDHGVYRTSGDLLYLTGINEPRVALVLIAGKKPEAHLFLRPYDRHDETWNGPRMKTEDGPAKFGVDGVHPFKNLETKLADWLVHHGTFWSSIGESEKLDAVVQAVMRRLRTLRRGATYHLPMIREPGHLAHGLRLVKSREELDWMREAARITSGAYDRVFDVLKPGMNEGEIGGLLDYHFRRDGGGGPSYSSIVGSGVNACYLHYRKNDKMMKTGELVVIDAGASYRHYACDVTRTLPVTGRFNPLQAQVYDIVLEAQEAAIRKCRPGSTHLQVHLAAVAVLTRGLMKLKALKTGSVQLAMKKKSFFPYYPHGTGHWLGLDVHDVGPYTSADGRSTALKPGMVLTVEPGLYFSPSIKGTPKALKGLGVRIEDDILITPSGHEVLTRRVPKTRQEIEAIMSAQRGR